MGDLWRCLRAPKDDPCEGEAHARALPGHEPETLCDGHAQRELGARAPVAEWDQLPGRTGR